MIHIRAKAAKARCLTLEHESYSTSVPYLMQGAFPKFMKIQSTWTWNADHCRCQKYQPSTTSSHADFSCFHSPLALVVVFIFGKHLIALRDGQWRCRELWLRVIYERYIEKRWELWLTIFGLAQFERGAGKESACPRGNLFSNSTVLYQHVGKCL